MGARNRISERRESNATNNTPLGSQTLSPCDAQVAEGRCLRIRKTRKPSPAAHKQQRRRS
jgi:hypothetical protein